MRLAKTYLTASEALELDNDTLLYGATFRFKTADKGQVWEVYFTDSMTFLQWILDITFFTEKLNTYETTVKELKGMNPNI